MQCALYLRSSKDRNEVSLPAQRRKLLDLAQAQNLAVVEEFSDAVESGKDENRPGFQALLRRMKARERPWTVLLVLDTSRLARNEYLAKAVHYEAEKLGIRIVYATLPETNSVVDVVLRAVFQAYDQVHSMTSKEKGLAGMAENVRQGYRAGGRAPHGYALERIPTGGIRDGLPVTKSRLVPGPLSENVGQYLAQRAEGIGRASAAAKAGLTLKTTTLIGMEWNALTYAGHTVWNVHAEKVPGRGYKGGAKRRPRGDWVIQYDTHARLISTEQAEKILAPLEAGRTRKYRTRSEFLLAGILVTPDGTAWHGDGGGRYRVGKGERINAKALERAVLGRITADLTSPVFIAELVQETRRASEPTPDGELGALRGDLKTVSGQIEKLTDLATQCEQPRPFLERIARLEVRRTALKREIAERRSQVAVAQVLRAISEADVERMLRALVSHIEEADKAALKRLIGDVAERIELDPDRLTCKIHYRIQGGELLASPWGFEPQFLP